MINHWSEEHDKMMDKIIRSERDEKQNGDEKYLLINLNESE